LIGYANDTLERAEGIGQVIYDSRQLNLLQDKTRIKTRQVEGEEGDEVL